MRMAFGIVSLLVTFAIILYMMVGTGYLSTVSGQNKQMRQQANVLGGKDPTGQVVATDSIGYRVDRAAGKPKLLVTTVMAGGPMEERYGLRPNDQIVEIAGLDFVDNISTRDSATEWLHTAYARGQPIVVVRNGTKVTLPDAAHVARIAERDRQAALAAASTGSPPPPTAAAPAAPTDDRTAVQKALDVIRSAPEK